MTRQRSFKRLVRARMEKTGESYTAARASLLAAEEPKATESGGWRRPTRRSGAEPDGDGSSGSTCSTNGARPSGRTGRSRAGSPHNWGSSRWLGGPGGHRQLRARPRPACRRGACRRVRGHRLEDRGGAGRAALRRVRRRVATRALAARRRAARAHRDEAEVGALRLGRRRDAGHRRVRRRRARRRAPWRSSTHGYADAEEAERMKAFWRERLDALKSAARGR